jgi:hypothetical protein
VRGRSTGRAARLAALAACLGLARPADATVELLHVEANEGGSSGGHAALRLGAATYHFQNVGGLLLLAREDSRSFVHDYALLQNRPIHALRIEVAPEAERAARGRFQERLAAQRSQLDALSALRAERSLLALLLRSARGEEAPGDALAIPGAGYFEDAGPGAPADPAVAALREAVVRERGEGFFTRRQRELREEMAGLALEPDAAAAPPPRLDAYAPLPLRYGFGARYADLAAAQVALAVLAEARGLRAEGLRTGEEPSLRLSPDAAHALRAFAGRLRAGLLRRLGAAPPDCGRALLVGMARLAAVELSLREGRLRVLDAFGDGAPTLDAGELAGRREILPAIAVETGGAARAALRRFVARGGSEAAYADLEDAVNRHLELVGAWREGRALRAQSERLVPARGAPLREPVALRAGPEALARALAAASERERRLAGEIERLHGYHLLAHNCVSELFATLESAFGSRERAAAVLGGRFGGGAGLDSIPFVAAASAARRYRVGDVPTIPSLRRARLARMRVAEGGLRVALRESSPLTARAGRRGSRDSFFLFYTDHVFWPRPLLGALNLAAGAGEAAFGLLRAPLDGGRTLVRGLHGALMSLPELAFVNLRKGTNDWVPESAWQELGLPAEASAR